MAIKIILLNIYLNYVDAISHGRKLCKDYMFIRMLLLRILEVGI